MSTGIKLLHIEKWFRFTAWNCEPYYGFGTAAEAQKYCDILNRQRQVDVYGYDELEREYADRLESGEDSDGFHLDLHLQWYAEYGA